MIALHVASASDGGSQFIEVDMPIDNASADTVAVSVARQAAIFSERPSEFGSGEAWINHGRRIEADYAELERPLAIASVLAELQPLLPTRYAPLNAKSGGNQGYLFSLEPRAGRLLESRIVAENGPTMPNPVVAAIDHAPIPGTTKKALIDARIGQGKFRLDLFDLWNARCCVTGLNIPSLLRASHIRPWSESDNAQRLDPFNGLLLSPAYDAAFDAGLLTFNENGAAILSGSLRPEAAACVGIVPSAQIVGFQSRHQSYLAYHRNQVFQRY
jgi:putative restriction endonuclease